MTRAADFLALHVPGQPLLMPNAWDRGSAVLLQSLGFAATATTSSGFAATLGRLDGGVTREEALAHAGLVDKHLSDGRDWLLGGAEPTFADTTLCTAIAFSKYPVNATPLDERFEQLNRYWRTWQRRRSFQRAYADGGSGLAELDRLAAD